MKTLTPQKVAIRAATLTAASLSVLLFPIAVFYVDFPVSLLLIPFPFVFYAIAYYLFHYLMERYIDQKIKLIYRSIHTEKLGRGLKGMKVDMKKDVFREVNRDVEHWAQENRDEIEQLREQVKFRREFIGNLSHEFKTPLTIIQGNILTLMEGAVEDKRIRDKFLLKASENVERLENLIHDLDNITRLESGSAIVEPEKTNIVKLCADVLENLERKAKKAEIHIRLKKGTPKEITVMADRHKIDQVITNLVVNSINYGKPGGSTTISFEEVGDNILVEVADTGVGVPPSELPRIFERFYRVDKSRSRHVGGTGLGLAIVKHIIEAHDQTINVRSEPDKGSTFSFTLHKA